MCINWLMLIVWGQWGEHPSGRDKEKGEQVAGDAQQLGHFYDEKIQQSEGPLQEGHPLLHQSQGLAVPLWGWQVKINTTISFIIIVFRNNLQTFFFSFFFWENLQTMTSSIIECKEPYLSSTVVCCFMIFVSNALSHFGSSFGSCLKTGHHSIFVIIYLLLNINYVAIFFLFRILFNFLCIKTEDEIF